MRLLVPRRLLTGNAAGPWRNVVRAGDRFVSFFQPLQRQGQPARLALRRPAPCLSADNWTYFSLNLNEGDLVEIALEDGSGNDLVAGQCAVADAATLTYARAFAFYFAPPNNYINCADGFTPNM